MPFYPDLHQNVIIRWSSAQVMLGILLNSLWYCVPYHQFGGEVYCWWWHWVSWIAYGRKHFWILVNRYYFAGRIRPEIFCTVMSWIFCGSRTTGNNCEYLLILIVSQVAYDWNYFVQLWFIGCFAGRVGPETNLCSCRFCSVIGFRGSCTTGNNLEYSLIVIISRVE